jgi:cell division protein FtsQ
MPKLSPPPDRDQSVLGYSEPAGSRRSSSSDRDRSAAGGRSGDRRPTPAARRPGPARAAAAATAVAARTGTPNPLRRLARRAGDATGALRPDAPAGRPSQGGRGRPERSGERSGRSGTGRSGTGRSGSGRSGPASARAGERSGPAGDRSGRPRPGPARPDPDRQRSGRQASGRQGSGRATPARTPVAGRARVRERERAKAPDGDAVPSIDPRFRDRWVAARRAEGHRRLRVLFAAGVVAVLVAGGIGVLHTPWLAVRHVRATATPHLPAAEITQLSGLSAHPPMINVDSAAIRRRLLAQPWVQTATVTRSWPDTVRLAVTERRPVAVVGQGAGAVLVDGTGRVLGAAPGAAGLPQLAGVTGAPAPGAWLPGSGPAGPGTEATGVALAVAAALPPAVASQVLTVTVGAGGDVTLALANRVTIADLGPVTTEAPGAALAGTIVRQTRALAAVAASVDLRSIGRVDLTVPDHPALTPVQAGATVSTTARG